VIENLKVQSEFLLSIVLPHIAEVSLENDTNYELARQALKLFNQFIISRKDDWNILHLTDLWDVYRRCDLNTFANTLYLIRKLNLKPTDVRQPSFLDNLCGYYRKQKEISLMGALTELTVQVSIS
jgi:hypothetical protein